MHKARCLLQTHFAVTCVGREDFRLISQLWESAVSEKSQLWQRALKLDRLHDGLRRGGFSKKDKNRSELMSKLDTVDKGPKWSSMSRPHFDVRNWEFISINIARSVPRRENFTSFDSVFRWKIKIKNFVNKEWNTHRHNSSLCHFV